MTGAPSFYLLEGTESLIVEDDKLPSNGQILKYLIFHLDKKKSVRVVAAQALPMLFESYDKVFESLTIFYLL